MPRAWLGMLVIAGGVWWCRRDPSPEVVPLQATTLAHGFAVIERASRVTELDEEGRVMRTTPLRRMPADTRVVGFPISADVSLVWQAGKRVHVADLDQLDRPQIFGTSVDRLCSQTASSGVFPFSRRGFGVGWLETSGQIRFVHGSAFLETAVGDELATATKPSYCGISTADDDFALLVRTGTQTELTRCDSECGPSIAVDVPADETILAFGCGYRYCMIASRADRTTQLTWFDERGRRLARAPLRDACADTRVEIAGQADRFAVAYSTGGEAVVGFSESPGELRTVWQRGGDPNTAPALSWWAVMLLVASQRDGKLETTTMLL